METSGFDPETGRRLVKTNSVYVKQLESEMDQFDREARITEKDLSRDRNSVMRQLEDLRRPSQESNESTNVDIGVAESSYESTIFPQSVPAQLSLLSISNKGNKEHSFRRAVSWKGPMRPHKLPRREMMEFNASELDIPCESDDAIDIQRPVELRKKNSVSSMYDLDEPESARSSWYEDLQRRRSIKQLRSRHEDESNAIAAMLGGCQPAQVKKSCELPRKDRAGKSLPGYMLSTSASRKKLCS